MSRLIIEIFIGGYLIGFIVGIGFGIWLNEKSINRSKNRKGL